MQRMFAAIALTCASTFVQAATLEVHNTGVDENDALVAAGSETAFWTLISQPASGSLSLGSAPFRFRHPLYVPDTASAAWVAPNASGNAGASGFYTYRLTVDLSGFDPASAVISGQFTSDNGGNIALNGIAGAYSAYAGYSVLNNFSFDDGFVAGLNFIDVTVDNAGDPTAFFVQFTSATAEIAPVPLPGALGLMAGALAGLGVLRRRRAA